MTEGSPKASCAEVMSLPERLAVVRELMSSLEVVTRSGRDHVMQKLVRIHRGEILREGLPLTGLQLRAAMKALTALEQETGRATPIPGAFNDSARVVVDALSRAWAATPAGG